MMKVAIAHDWLNQMGGAENVLEQMVEIYPNAPVFSTIYSPDLMPQAYRQWNIKTTLLNHAPFIHRHHQPYLPLYPPAVKSMDFTGFNLILSNKSGFIHGLRHTTRQLHICYCLAPTRYLWNYNDYASREGFGRLLGTVIKPIINRLRQWDFEAAQIPTGEKGNGVNHFIAISKEIQARIERFYQRDSVVIYPPVDINRFQPLPVGKPVGDYYLVVSRLIPYKRIDLVVQAMSHLKRRLIIVGEGRDKAQLEAIAAPTVEFKGRLPWAEVVSLMANCRAFLFPGFEDFGIAPVEAQATGRPVIAFAKGGALDTIIEGETGLFFREQSVEALIEVIKQFEQTVFDPASARTNAERFSNERFKQELGQFVADRWQEWQVMKKLS